MQKVALYKKVLIIKIKGCNNMMQHIHEFVEILEKLTEIGIQIQKELLLFY